MAETTEIGWTDATVNFWWGCTHAGPGCLHCYAETWDKRTGGAHFGLGVPRRYIMSATTTIRCLQREADQFEAENGRRRRVFMSSMSDLFDKEAPVDWRAEALRESEAADRLDIQFLTKRVSLVPKMVPPHWKKHWPRHIGLMITVVNQKEADRDIPRLLQLKREFGIPWVGLSVEPMIGSVNLASIKGALAHATTLIGALTNTGWHPTGLDLVIAGGETGPGARPMHPDWPLSLRDQCEPAGVAFFFKQWGNWFPRTQTLDRGRTQIVLNDGRLFDDVHAAMPAEWKGKPVTPFNPTVMINIGKKKSGRVLDGRTHDEMPLVING